MSFTTKHTFTVSCLESAVVLCINLLPCKQGVVSPIPSFHSLLDENLSCGPISILLLLLVEHLTKIHILFISAY